MTQGLHNLGWALFHSICRLIRVMPLAKSDRLQMGLLIGISPEP